MALNERKIAAVYIAWAAAAMAAMLLLEGGAGALAKHDREAIDDEERRWLDRMARTSSPLDLQPDEFNDADSVWIKHQHQKKIEGRSGLEEVSTSSTKTSKTSGSNSSTNSSSSGAKTIIVAKDGSGHFKSVRAAIRSIPKSNSKRVIIYIKAGIYKEKVVVDQDWITLQGEGRQLTEIQWNDTATSAGNTFKSASVAVNGKHFTARDISFRNTAPAPPGGAVGRQAVALRISGDYAAFFNVGFYGAQDTLYDHKGRHYFYRCIIEGSIDFVFGNGRSFYFRCRLHSIASPNGSLTAQKRNATSENTGFSFVRCVVTGSGNIYLGRAWGPASRVVYSYTYFDDIILPQGWFNWADPSREKTVFYAEYKCYGPGANRANRVPWSRLLTDKQALPFIHTGFINGEKWLSKA